MGGREATQRPVFSVVAVALAVAVGGCDTGDSDKAGGAKKEKPVVLTMANVNGVPIELEPFAAAVSRHSKGNIRIEFKDKWRKGSLDYEAGAINDVKAGKVDLAWAGSRAFDSVGGSGFAALSAPLLIGSYELQQQVLESPLADGMLDRLKPLGLVGLGILPGPMHKPLGVSRLLGPEHYRGKTLGTWRSRVARETLRTLGARGKEVPIEAGIDGLDGIETYTGSVYGNQYSKVAEYLTANVNLWPRPQVLFMNRRAFAALTDAQRDALDAAMRSAMSTTTAFQKFEEKETAATLCRGGLNFVSASAGDIASLRRAVQPVYDRLERDQRTKAAIEEIETVRSRGRFLPSAPRCSEADRRSRGAGRVTPIDGRYLRTVKAETKDTVPENYGTWRWVLDRGRFVYDHRNGVAREHATGTYNVTGDIFVFTIKKASGVYPTRTAGKPGEQFHYRWSLYRDELTLKPVPGKVSPPNREPWRRLGDVR